MPGDSLSHEEVQELARVFREHRTASLLLDAAGFPRGRHPTWHTYSAEEFWWQVNNQLDSGVLADGRRRVLDAARRQFPANRVFAAGTHQEPSPVPDQRTPRGAAPNDRRAGHVRPSPAGDPGSSAPWWRRSPLASGRVRLAVAAGTVVAVLAGVLTAVVVIRGGGGGDDLRAEPVGKPVIDAFTPPMGQDVHVQPVSSAQGPVGGILPAESAGLFGGTRSKGTCDRGKMVRYLRAHPPLLAAWTNVLKVSPADLDRYVNTLTPVVLRTDTLVTNHGYAAGKTTEFQAVFQAGTAVLVDGNGTPVVKCGCGNPLTKPRFTPTTAKKARVGGERWGGFTTKAVTRIQPFTVTAEVFVLGDVNSKALFTRDRGTAGDRDHDFVPAADIDWRNTRYRIDCAAGTAFTVHNGVGEVTNAGRTYDLRVVNVAVGDLAGGSSAEVAVLLTCGARGAGPPEQLLYVYRDGPNIMDRPRPPLDNGQPATRFADDQLTIKDGLLVTGAYYRRAGGTGTAELRPVRFVWDGQRFIPTTATRSPQPTASAPSGIRADLSGTWRGTLHITEPITGDIPFTLEFRQDGSTLTGRISSSMAECGLSGSPIRGTLTGDTVAFVITGDQNQTSFRGRVAGDTISGVGTSRCYGGEGSWTVRRG
jgi:hypothetical protein